MRRRILRHASIVVPVLAAIGVITCRPDTRSNTPTAPHTGPSPGTGPQLAVSAVTDPPVIVGAGNVAYCSSTGDEATAAILDTVAGVVFTAGNNVNSSTATIADYNNCYQPSWGRHVARTRPAVGDKDYATASGGGFYTYFHTNNAAAVGDSAKNYYSYDLGTWHVVVLNSSVSMSSGSTQEVWLKNDLATHAAACTVAIWDQPRFYTSGTRSGSLPVWNDLYAAGAELVINGHQKNYERFAPQRPDGTADAAYGVREIIAATGGYSHGSVGSTIEANSEIRNTTSFGVLKVTLDVSSYTWQFIPVAGSTFTDGGTNQCHGAPPPVANPKGPYKAEKTLTFDGSASYDPSGAALASYSWNFGDGTTGTGSKPTHTYTAYGAYTVTLAVTSSKGVSSASATTTATIQNVAPTVTAAPDAWVAPNTSYTLNASFSDPGNDGPFPYTVDWGDGTTSTGSAASVGAISATHAYTAQSKYTVTVSVTDAGGLTASNHSNVLTTQPSASAIIFIGAGDIASCGSTPATSKAEQTARILDVEDVAGVTVWTAGDNAYPDGLYTDYTSCYDPTWGRHNAHVRPAAGNHEYMIAGAPGMYNYYKQHNVFVGDSANNYYSYDLVSADQTNKWHIIVLNDAITFTTGSPQEQWLEADLAAHPSKCSLAIWHRPMVYAGGSGRPGMKAMWTPLYNAGAEIILNGHAHDYQRYAEATPTLVPQPGRGIREWIVGTGGASIGISGTATNLEVSNGSTYGVLKLWLDTDGYYWKFIPIAGQTFTDVGYTACH